MRTRLAVFAPLFSVCLPACGTTQGGGEPQVDMATAPFVSTCTAAAPGAESLRPAGRAMDGTVILPGGRKLSPAGTVIDVGGFPLALRVLPGGRYVVVTDGAYGDEALRIVDLLAVDPHKAVVSTAAYPRTEESHLAPALFYGMALTKDGTRLYVSDGGYDPVPDKTGAQHYNLVDVYDIAGNPPKLAKNDALAIKLAYSLGADGKGAPQQRIPAGMTLSPDEKLLYVATQFDSTLAIVDLSPGMTWGAEIGRAFLPGQGAYDVAVDEGSHTAFLSLWGGLTKGMGKYVDGVALVDVTNPKAPVAMAEPIATGKASEAELLVGGKVYIANADADTISVMDVATHAVQSSPVGASMLLGSAPNNLAIDPGMGGAPATLYVADAGENAAAVIDLATMKLRGHIPTAWYPTAVAVLPDGALVIASAKGLGLGPSDVTPAPAYMQGVLQLLPRPSDGDLAKWDPVVAANLDRPAATQPAITCTGTERAFPLPPDPKGASPIKHVFLIVRENKTYDSVLGDLAGSNGKKELVMFGEDVTPNLHALARAFTNLDNFYSNAEQSIQGHEWTTAGMANDYTEKGWLTTWGRATRPYGAFASGLYERLGMPGANTIWKQLDAAGIAYHNYGEVVNTAGALRLYDTSYPGVFFDLNRPDVNKIQYVIDTITDPGFAVEPFSYIGLPNDHTYGTTPGKLTPQSMVADNDEATGRFVDALSHSPLWATSLVIVIEDDPQDGGDHVEPHRSPCVVMSPWVKRGNVDSANRDVPSLYRTIEGVLGVGPMNQFDGHGAAMYEVFTTTPDYTPYTFIPRKVPVKMNAVDAPMAGESSAIDFSKPDQAPLGRILWKATHGTAAEPPWTSNGFVRDDDD